MANIKYFSDGPDGPVELIRIFTLENDDFKKRFPDIKGRRSGSYSMWVGRAVINGPILPTTRMIEFKRQPSRHACDARCMNATGRTMKCECACGGVNHGRGRFVAEPAE